MSEWNQRNLTDVFEKPQIPFNPGIYYGEERVGKSLVIVVDQEVKEGVYEVLVHLEPDDVLLSTDSIEVLRGITSRGFPLEKFARFLGEYRHGGQNDLIFDTYLLPPFDPRDTSLQNLKKTIRVIARRKPNSFEIRLIK